MKDLHQYQCEIGRSSATFIGKKHMREAICKNNAERHQCANDAEPHILLAIKSKLRMDSEKFWTVFLVPEKLSAVSFGFQIPVSRNASKKPHRPPLKFYEIGASAQKKKRNPYYSCFTFLDSLRNREIQKILNPLRK